MLNKYQNIIITLTFSRFGSALTLDFLEKLAIGGEINDISDKKDRDNRKCEVIFNHYQSSMARQFISSLKNIFNPSYISIEERTENSFSNKWDLYEYLLKHHDWTYMYSDDHRVWSSGQNTLDRINKLKEELSKENKEKAEQLFEFYAPKG